MIAFYAHLVSVSQLCNGFAHLLSVTVFTFAPPEEANYQFQLGWPTCAHGRV